MSEEPKFVRFIYVPTGHVMPPEEDRDPAALYFNEDGQQLYKGASLIADHIDPIDIEKVLEPYKVKSVDILGEGSWISSAVFDEEEGKLTLTQSAPPVTGRGQDAPATTHVLVPGEAFTAVVDTPVENSQIKNTRFSYVLPAQISDVRIVQDETTAILQLLIDFTDGTERTKTLDMFGTAAFEDADDFVRIEDLAPAVRAAIDSDPTIARIDDIPTWNIQ